MNNLFFKTRLRLTGLYIAIIVILLFVFSQIIYVSVSNNIKNNIEGDFSTKQQQNTFVQKQIGSLRVSLVSANIIILVIVGGLSYFLARKTFGPVERSMELQKQFLSNASHELRTPLAILQTNLDNIRKEKKAGSKDYKDTLSNLEEVERMTSLVNELLLLSRLDATQATLPLTRISINSVVPSSTERFSAYAKTHQIQLQTKLPKSNLVIRADKTLLSQALDNLLKNAIDYTHKHGTVTVSLTHNEDKAVLTVVDTGIGISTAHLPNIFNRFYKVDEARSERQGSGLGLAITQTIIHKHNGTITLHSTVGKGTTVTISIPLFQTS